VFHTWATAGSLAETSVGRLEEGLTDSLASGATDVAADDLVGVGFKSVTTRAVVGSRESSNRSLRGESASICLFGGSGESCIVSRTATYLLVKQDNRVQNFKNSHLCYPQ
jgi:hypothetical protein